MYFDSNQEVIEQIKSNITELQNERQKDLEAAEKTAAILKYIKEHLSEMIYKLQEVDESQIELAEKSISITGENLSNFLKDDADEEDFIKVIVY